jgi:hypothetical protein
LPKQAAISPINPPYNSKSLVTVAITNGNTIATRTVPPTR